MPLHARICRHRFILNLQSTDNTVMSNVVFLVVAGPQFMPFSNAQLAAPSAPAHVSNPWSQTGVQPAVTSPSPVVTVAGQSKVSDAEFWLNSTASQIDPFAAVPNVGGKPASQRPRVVNGSADVRLTGQTQTLGLHTTTAMATVHHQSINRAEHQPSSFVSTPVCASEQNYSFAAAHRPGVPTVNTNHPLFSNQSGVRAADSHPFDPFDSTFDSAWAAKSGSRSVGAASAPVNNPFQTSVDKVMPAFEVKL